MARCCCNDSYYNFFYFFCFRLYKLTQVLSHGCNIHSAVWHFLFACALTELSLCPYTDSLLTFSLSVRRQYTESAAMYCLQWMLPILVLPKPVNPALYFHHSMFMALYLLDFFISRKPCTICSAVFIIALTLLCYSGMPGCVFTAFCSSDDSQM